MRRILMGALALSVTLVGCGEDASEPEDGGGMASGGSESGSGGKMSSGSGGKNNMPDETLCAKYGGVSVVEKVVKENVVGAIAGDCRINSFFTSLSDDSLTRLSDCLAIQVEELFGCEDVTYEGSEASNGLACRSMTKAHAGLDISQADFDALIEDVVAGLQEAGVEQKDIEAAAPALLGMSNDIVASDRSKNTMPMCEGAGGAGGSEQ